MYQFSKEKMDSGEWKFELDDIKLFIDGFSIHDDKHWIKTPETAIAYFMQKDNVYSVSNVNRLKTAEDLYDAMIAQYAFFSPNRMMKDAS